MRSACFMGLAGLCAFAVAALADDKTPAAGKYLPPEVFLTAGRATEYLPHARLHLQQNAENDNAPRIAMDMLMFATAMQDQAGVQEAKRLLLFQHGGSLPAAYLIVSSEPDDLGKVLKSTFTSPDRPLDKRGLQEFHQATMIFLRVHGANLMDDELRAQAALSAPDAATAATLRQRMSDASEAAKTLAIALDARLTSREKFVRLKEFHDFSTARAWQSYLFDHEFGEADRADADVQEVVVENLLTDAKFTPALEILTKLTGASADPKLLFYRGWAEAATDHVPAAVITLRTITERFPESDWAAPAQELAEAIAELSTKLDEHVAGFEELYVGLREHGPEMVELDLNFAETTPAEPVQILVGLDFAGDGIEFLLRKADKPLLGYSSRSDSSHFFVDGETSIHRFNEKGPSPQLNLNISPSATGYHFSFSVNFSSSAGNLRKSISSLLDSSAFATREARKDWVRYNMKKGGFPAKVVTIKGERSFRWLFPSPREPKLGVIEVRLTSEGRLSSITWGSKGRVHSTVRCGPSDRMALTRRKWPDLPVHEGTELGADEMFRLLRVGTALLGMGKESPAESNAVKAQPPRR